jgi:UDP-2,3-diacylglucosamine hydrolase
MGEGPALPEVELDGPAILVADLHLDPFDEERCGRFAAWVRALEEPRLLVLGDLFDAWVGPAHERAPGACRVMDAFREHGDGGEVVVVQGNRDRLLGESFERASGARVLRDGLVGVRPDGERLLLLHGDELCTRDHAYQRLRRVLRSAPVQWLGPRLPLWLSGRIARRLRRASERAVALKLPEEKAVQPAAVREQARLRGCRTLVCGHVHAARDERLEAAQGDLRWVVLDAFGGRRDAARLGPGGLELGHSGFRDAVAGHGTSAGSSSPGGGAGAPAR